MNAIHLDSRHSEEERRHRIYDGHFYVFSPTPATRALCSFARQMIEEAFHPLDPRTAQFDLSVEEFVAIAGPLKPQFIHHPRVKGLVTEMLAEFGCDLNETYFDVPRLRVVTHDRYLTSGVGYVLHPHRDTWYSAPMCQVHWWLPIYAIEAENSLAFHPKYWDRPVENDSHLFNYYDWNRERRSATQHVKNDPRFQPHAQGPIETEPELRFVCDAGGAILFSAAHLHSTVPNVSGVTRFSMDFRTVHLGDLAAHRGAPNLDSAPQGTTLRDFLRCSDFAPLPPEIINEYDDAEAIRGREEFLVFRPDKASSVAR